VDDLAVAAFHLALEGGLPRAVIARWVERVARSMSCRSSSARRR
jgi:hypothetical protein